ncbi:hypothetical protein [Radiobacillus sp. PE A8.2]|uniref:hypothetical protein n=1 Tax=Radiobacillus sp. PE A8.2 TaxID=3380349 RepID=UPI00389078BB
MGKRTIAKNWDEVNKDSTGCFVSVDYTCPHCDYDNYEMILVGADNIDKMDEDFETDQVCKICGEDVIVECR